jgi:hypothetical protein
VKLRITILVGFALLVGACSTSGVRLGTEIDCDTEQRGRLILFAQAVPTSSAIPCLEELPAGWQVDSIEARSGEAVIVFENDTHDVAATASLTKSCSITGEGESTDDPDVLVYRTASGALALVFTGGCFEVEMPEVVTVDEASALLKAIGYLSRDELRALTGWTL